MYINSNASFVIQPLGGLANRMRVVAKCWEIAQVAGVQMQVNWVKDGDCGADWQDLFEESSFIVQKEGASRDVVWQSQRWYHRMPVWKYKLKNDFDKMLTAPVADAMLEIDEEHPEIFCHHVEQCLKQGKRIFFATGSFMGIPSDLSMFRPIASLKTQIDAFLHATTSNIYGVHIRRTDNKWAIESSPLELFIGAMRHVVANDSDACFYLATDDKQIIKILFDEFGKRIVFRDKEFSRTSTLGVQDALIDMWLLSKTRRIFGSFYSSFSEMASWIGKNELVIIKK